jgi:hypothetical protein
VVDATGKVVALNIATGIFDDCRTYSVGLALSARLAPAATTNRAASPTTPQLFQDIAFSSLSASWR